MTPYPQSEPRLKPVPRVLFMSRWLQLPLCLAEGQARSAIIGISSIHLLKTFINAAAYEPKVLIAQTVIHITFLASAVAIAAVDRIMPERAPHRGTGEEH